MSGLLDCLDRVCELGFLTRVGRMIKNEKGSLTGVGSGRAGRRFARGDDDGCLYIVDERKWVQTIW